MQQQTAQLLTDLFRNIALEETLIEKKRKEISQQPDFEPTRAFYAINKDQSNKINANQIVQFMNENYGKINEQEAEMILIEYDCNGDQKMTYDEFCQMILPSTDKQLRMICENRKQSYYYDQNKPIDYQNLLKMVRIIEKEMRLQNIKESIKKKLLKNEDFIKQKVFMEISNNQESIQIDDLVNFFKKYQFYPQREDLEAILRRVDHSGDQQISFDEFMEITSCNEKNQSPDELERSSIKQSPQSKQINEVTEEQNLKRSNSKQELFKPANQNVARKLNLDEFDSKQDQLMKDQEEFNNILILQSVAKQIIKGNKELEIRRQCLFQHQLFNITELFEYIDQNNNGYLSVDELENIAQQNQLNFYSSEKVINMFDLNQDGNLNLQEFTQSIIPINRVFQSIPRKSIKTIKDQNQRDMLIHQQLIELANIYNTVVQNEMIMEEIQQNLQITEDKVQSIFQSIDKMNIGYISEFQLKNYLEEKCLYKTMDDDIKMLMNALDLNKNGRIHLNELTLVFVSNLEQEEEFE